MVIELRQYTLRPGARDVLFELFDRALAEGQEAVGIRMIGWFRDLDDPNNFVWLRAFSDMAARAQALEAFYGGPVWAEHRNDANATMIDSDNVLLLRPAGGSVDALRNRRELVASIHAFPAPVTTPKSSASSASTDRPGRRSSPTRARTTSPRCLCGKASTSSSGSPTGRILARTRRCGCRPEPEVYLHLSGAAQSNAEGGE
jgi:NIPSNAP